MKDSHKMFADKFFETLNAKESAIYAGYSEDTAKQQGWQLLQREDVQEYLDSLRKELSEKHGVTKDRLIKEYAKIAFSDIRKLYTVDGGLKDIFQIDDEIAPAISSIESFDEYEPDSGEKLGTNRKIKLHDKLRALEALGKHLGFFEKDNEQSRIKLPETVTVNIHKPDDDN